MKESDFEDIGKRLHDEEADPPKAGWNRINHALNSPASPTNTVFLKRYWWMPLLFVAPAITYTIYQWSGDGQNLFPLSTQSSSLQNAVDIQGSKAELATKTFSETKDNNAERNTDQSAVISKDDSYRQGQNKTNGRTSNVNKLTTQKTDSGTLTTTGAKKSNDWLREGRATTPSASKIDTTNSKAELQRNDALMSKKNNASYSGDDVVFNVTHNRTESIFNKSPGNDATAASDANPGVKPGKEDSVILVATRKTQADNATINHVSNSDSKQPGKWRITASFVPLYIKETISPIDNDDILVTKVSRPGGTRKMGYALGIGVGKIISTHLVIDGEISFLRGQQSVNFSTATGNIDTLISTVQPDQSVVVTPVYETTARSITTDYGYTGIKLGASYYFMNGNYGRFNISASGGAYFKVIGNVKEKHPAGWVGRSASDLSKSNFTFTLSAGYNLKLNPSWELSINPSTTYFMRKKTTSDLPYNLSQRSFGVNFMLSKTF